MMIRTCAAAVLITTLSICGCATTNTNPPANGSAKAPTCMQNTGSRLPSGNCSAGRTYTHQDIDQTGQQSAAGALGMLDPSVTVGH